MKKLTLVSSDYWQAIYVDGKRYHEDHRIDIAEILRLLKIIDIKEVSAYGYMELESREGFPEKLLDVVAD